MNYNQIFKNSWPSLAKYSCYFDTGGQAASPLCPFVDVVNDLNSTLMIKQVKITNDSEPFDNKITQKWN